MAKKGKDIFSQIEQFFDSIVMIFRTVIEIFETMVCSVKFATNFSKCFIYYILDIIGYVLYLPFKLFFWVFQLRSVERALWEGIESVDQLCKAVTGYHCFHWSNDTMNDCYRCKNKKDTDGNNWLKNYIKDLKKGKDTQMTFFEVVLLCTLVGLLGYSVYYGMAVSVYWSIVLPVILSFFLFSMATMMIGNYIPWLGSLLYLIGFIALVVYMIFFRETNPLR